MSTSLPGADYSHYEHNPTHHLCMPFIMNRKTFHGVYPMKYGHGFVVVIYSVDGVVLSILKDSPGPFTHTFKYVQLTLRQRLGMSQCY